MGKDEVGKSIYAVSLVIAAGLFLAGLLGGYIIAEWRNSRISGMISETLIWVEDLGIADRLLADDCSLVSSAINHIVERMGKIEDEIAKIGNSREQERIGLEELRLKYHILSLRYYLYAENFKECLRNRTIVLYFYTKDCRKCEDQAVVLSAMKKKYGEALLVFPFDRGIGLVSVEMLAKRFNITEYPSLVIDGRVYSGFVGRKEFESAIKRMPEGQII